MIRRNDGSAALSVLLTSTIVAGSVMTLCSISSIIMTIVVEQADSNQAYYLARTDAAHLLRDFNHGRHDISSKVTAPDGYIMRQIGYGEGTISVTCTAHTGRAVHEVGFTYQSSSHQVTRWQDDMEVNASDPGDS